MQVNKYIITVGYIVSNLVLLTCSYMNYCKVLMIFKSSFVI